MMRRSASSTRPLSLLSGEEKGLPLPAGARPSPRGFLRTLRRKWPVYLLLTVVVLLLLGKFGTAPAPTPTSSARDSLLSHVGEVRREGAAPAQPVALQQPPDEALMAEDDLLLQHEDPVLSPEEQDRATQDAADSAAVREKAKRAQLAALTWFLYNGGVLPELDLPTLTAAAFEKALSSAWDATKAAGGAKGAAAVGAHGIRLHHADMKELFPGNWQAEAGVRTRVTVFSKSYCPYSRRAKGIIEQYDLDPPPFVVELDHRPDDMAALQDALLYLTGRRTVPNVILEGESLGGSDEVATLHGEGSLEKKLLKGQTKFIINDKGELESHEI